MSNALDSRISQNMINRLARASKFTKHLTPDSRVPSIKQSESAPPELLREARRVDGSFTWVAPEKRDKHDLKWISPAAAADLGLTLDINDEETAAILAGQKVLVDESEGMYPFAQNYAGHQFGSWAGQLGDGRAITLFRLGETEIQLKGAGLTPYSRFADGKAVLRSSIREALVSEYLHQLGVPTQRCLSLVSLPITTAHREKKEKCAVIARAAPSWIRIGTFQLHHATGNRQELRKLADFCIGTLGLGSQAHEKISADEDTTVDVKYDAKDGNRYFRMFRDSSLRNAKMMAACQAYGFLNGVLNTDNVSILGFSLDYGPFAFMDAFNSHHTPNHDDYMKRYGFQSSPVVMWWNCVKLGETLGELIGAGIKVDDPSFIDEGISAEDRRAAGELATELIMSVGDVFQETYESEYHRLLLTRMGLTSNGNTTEDIKLIEQMLHVMQEGELDFNLFFRKLATTQTPEDFMPWERQRSSLVRDSDLKHLLEDFFSKYNERLAKDHTPNRRELMDKANPKFVLRNSVLANVIELAELGNWDAFDAVAKLALDPFSETWENVPEMYRERYTSEKIASSERDSQLSCSS